MKVTRTIATGVFLGWMCQSSMAAPPLIERPSPPPCCADGQCLASPTTYGYYDTRWRRWPLESVAQASTAKPAALTGPMRQEVAPFVTPPPEQEDRKAPPPSVPTGEQPSANGPSGPGRTPAGPGGATPPAGTQPPASGTGFPTTPPTTPSTPPSTGPINKNISPDSPLNRSGTSPMGDADPPPSLPFGPTLTAPAQSPRGVSQQPAAVPVQSPTVKPVRAPSGDPPPAPPIALVNYEE